MKIYHDIDIVMTVKKKITTIGSIIVEINGWNRDESVA